ncbi:MAG: flagellar hook-associated protein FlgK [Desulfohalobiaceae bacterium]
MTGIGSILDIGRWGLFSSQSALETTGNNVANVDTPGYSRRSVTLEEGPAIDKAPGQMGTGVRAKEVIRHFDSFLEKQYLTKLTDQERWSALEENLKSVETLFNNAEGSGLNQALAEFWENWQELADNPDDGGVRSALLGKAQNLLNTVEITNTDMGRLQKQMDDFIQQDVQEANDLLGQIAEINQQIKEKGIPGKNNPNELLDKRNTLLRDLSKIMDIEIHEKGQWDMMVSTRAGQTLVDGTKDFELAFESAQAHSSLSPNSEFDGEIKFRGSSSHEYLLEVHQEGEAGAEDADDRAKLKISMDGGRTWLRDEEGELQTIDATAEDSAQSLPQARDLEVWFEEGSNNDLAEGDQFQVMPKSGVYWYETTSSKENITPRKLANGEDDSRRLSGGSLAGEFGFRDHYIGGYQEKLDEFSQVLSWEVNRLHSQGAGLQKFTEVLGTEKIKNADQPLGEAGAGLDVANRLQQGSAELYVYERNTGELVDSPQVLNFDPENDSLQDVRNNIDSLDHISASILDGQLQISGDDGYELAFGSDSSGLLAGLGINTFFQGTNAQDLALNSRVANNQDFINAARVNGAGEVNPGDNQTARDIAELQSQKVRFDTLQEGETNQTLQEYFNSLSADAGSDTSQAEYNKEYFQTLADDVKARQDAKSGVNLDEEMANLIKQQQAYTAAAKLITTAEQMMNTLMQIKQ